VVKQSNCELPNNIVDITLVPGVQFISCLRIDYCVITLKNTDAFRITLCAGETVLKLHLVWLSVLQCVSDLKRVSECEGK
jgi:hypothetical protein